MGLMDNFYAQLKAINHDREEHLQRISSNSSKKFQDEIIKYVLQEQYEGYKHNITKHSIFTMIDNFAKDHVKSDSKYLDLFYESQEQAKVFFLGLANLTSTETEH